MSDIKRVYDVLVRILRRNPKGLSRQDIFQRLRSQLSDIPGGSLHSYLSRIPEEFPKAIKRRGDLYKWKGNVKGVKRVTSASKKGEEVFYKPFASFLKRKGICSDAMPVGRDHRLGGKWGTPDVMGKRAGGGTTNPIISAEIKDSTDGNALVTAFGQACVYKLFSTEVYLVIPKNNIHEDDKKRITTLCQTQGIGLVLFDNTKRKRTRFAIVSSAETCTPNREEVERYEALLIEKDILFYRD